MIVLLRGVIVLLRGVIVLLRGVIVLLPMMVKKKSFTLIELIVVIAIIAVVSAAGIVSFSSLTGDRLTASARKIVSDLSWARQRAVATHRRHRVTFNLATESYQVFDDLNGDFSFDPANEEIKRQNLDGGVNLVSVTPGPNQLTFGFPQGTLVGGAANRTITLNSQGKTRQIMVFSDTGYVRIQ